MKSLMSAVVLLALAAAGVGCGRVFDEAAGAGFGAKTNVVVIRPLPHGTYGPVTLGSFTSSMESAAPNSILIALGMQVRTKLAGDRALASGRPIKIDGVIVHYEGSSLMDKVFGPQNEVVVRVTATDAASGQTLGMANILGRARGGMSSASEGDLSEAFADGLAKWLKKAAYGRE